MAKVQAPNQRLAENGDFGKLVALYEQRYTRSDDGGGGGGDGGGGGVTRVSHTLTGATPSPSQGPRVCVTMATAGPWTTLGDALLDPSLLKALTEGLSLPTMTPVQAAAIPPLLSNKDVCVDAETGSGKTLSFLVPIAQTLLYKLRARPTAAVRALVVLPTRELATQVHAVATELFSHLPGPLRPAPLIGGATGSEAGPAAEHAGDLRLVVATPGRLAAALGRGQLHVGRLEVLVLDEADRLLDMGFAVALTDILTRLPRQRRTGIYSATQTAAVDALARAGLRNPVRVAVRVALPGAAEGAGAPARQRTPASLECTFRVVSPRDKLATLLDLLAARPRAKFIVYFITCASVEFHRRLPLGALLGLAHAARGDAAPAARAFCALHGRLSQKRRDRALAEFGAGTNAVLLCTDVAARGLDVPDVDGVVQFDAPQDPDAYVHRVGRTARLGRRGDAMILLAESEAAYADFLRVRRCPVAEAAAAAAGDAAGLARRVAAEVRRAVLGDRAVLEAGEAAFLAYLRAYKEHRCRFLLKLEEVDVDSVADGFGLLRLPKFHEFRKLRGRIGVRNAEGVVIRDIAFKDKAREKRRQAEIRERIANRAQWKAELAAKKGKGKKRRRRGRGDEGDGAATGKQGKQGKQEDEDEDEDEEDFGEEAAQLRKVKRGKLSRAAFDAAAGYAALDEEGAGEGADGRRPG